MTSVPRNPSDNFWFEATGRRSIAGETVTIERARKLPVVRDCLQILAQTTACLAFGVFAKQADGSRMALPDHPVAQLLTTPNGQDSSYDFFFNLVDDLASAGRHLSIGLTENQLRRVAPNDYVVEISVDGARRFRVTQTGRPQQVWLDDEVFFIALPPAKSDGTGRSPILDDGVEAIGAALALQAYGSSFFANDATPPFVFKHKGAFKDKASKDNFLSAWQRWFGGRNRGKPGVLEFDMDIIKLAHTNDEAQFLETRKEAMLDVTRLWRMPPHKVGILDKATFSNIEHQALEFVIDTIGPYLELIERAVAKQLLGDDPAVYFEFNVDSLLRGDIKTRYEAYAIARQWGWLSVNDIRRRENQNGIGDIGDRYIEPLNMKPAGSDAAPAAPPAAR